MYGSKKGHEEGKMVTTSVAPKNSSYKTYVTASGSIYRLGEIWRRKTMSKSDYKFHPLRDFFEAKNGTGSGDVAKTIRNRKDANVRYRPHPASELGRQTHLWAVTRKAAEFMQGIYKDGGVQAAVQDYIRNRMPVL